MSIDKILKDLSQLGTYNKDCKKNCEEDCRESLRGQSDEVNATIKNFLQDKSSKEYSEYFSEVFDLWIKATKTTININVTPFNEEVLDKKYQEYTSIYPIPMQKTKNKEEHSSTSKIEEDHQGKKMIEYLLSQLWLKIFQENLVFLGSSDKKNNLKYFHTNWPLYELINQISKTIHQITQEGSTEKIKISSLKENDKNDILENTDEMCKYILDTYILGVMDNEAKSTNWFPELKYNQEIQLPYILATSDLVSYIYEYELMNKKKKAKYEEDIKATIGTIYNKLAKNNLFYTAIESYMQNNDTEDIVVKYKNKLLSPRTIFTFTISIIQEVVKKTLTQSTHNIFYVLNNNQSRDKGLTEKKIMDKIEKDVKSYKLIYYYFDKTGQKTINTKLKKLDAWVSELNKLRYGVLDDYLFDLAKTEQITFKETTVTSIEIPKR